MPFLSVPTPVRDGYTTLLLSLWMPALESWVGLGLNYTCLSVRAGAAMNLAWVCSQVLTQPLENAVPAGTGLEAASSGHG